MFATENGENFISKSSPNDAIIYPDDCAGYRCLSSAAWSRDDEPDVCWYWLVGGLKPLWVTSPLHVLAHSGCLRSADIHVHGKSQFRQISEEASNCLRTTKFPLSQVLDPSLYFGFYEKVPKPVDVSNFQIYWDPHSSSRSRSWLKMKKKNKGHVASRRS